jgi:hypothetical protein
MIILEKCEISSPTKDKDKYQYLGRILRFDKSSSTSSWENSIYMIQSATKGCPSEGQTQPDAGIHGTW